MLETNKYVDYRFIRKNVKDGNLYKVWDKDAGVEIANDIRRLSDNKINPWIVGNKINIMCKKHRSNSVDDLYKKLSNMVIRHFKKNNKDKTNRIINKKIRKALKDEMNYIPRIIDECKSIYDY